MINILQNPAIVKSNTLFPSIKKPIYHYYPIFIYALSLQANIPISNKKKQPTIWSIYIYSKDDSTRFEKRAKALLDLPIFIDKKDSFID